MEVQQTQSSDVHLSKEPQTPGLDLQAAQIWIYPTNYPIREYQLNIVQNALYKNTLVSLPTGLGKTFIAAVLMYNFYRWYPGGKVIFMAPTRPLVKQQVDACYDIMAIPKKTTAELTGTKMSASREDIWKDKRVFFITPQILQNDLDRIEDLGSHIRCLVFDEAHKARGNYAYCEIIRKLTVTNKYFRVLALSATPGASISDVLEVVNNLLITHLEFRTEESVDVHSYVFQRNLTTVVVPLGEKLGQIKEDYLQVLDYHTRTLVKYKVIQGNCGSLTKGKIFLTMKNFQQNCRGSGAPNYAEIMKCLNICVTLYHAFELLVRHGLRSFLVFFEEHIDKPLLRGNARIISIMEDIKNYLGPPLNLEPLPNGEYTAVSKDIKFGHPKFYKLQEILLKNFEEKSDNTRAIVFFEYRDSVMEAYALLHQSKPILRPRIFLGQKNGITQKSQINVVKAFREGHCNTLLSTSIGEEGLDVGEVDLIVCFDISNKSPIRMVQRMGRTGRKKEGSVIVLVTEGKEQQTLKDCLIHKNNITQHVLSSKEIARSLCSDCPRMIPDNISPTCEKMFITVEKSLPKKGATLKDIFRSVSRNSETQNFSPDLVIIDTVERIPETQLLWKQANPLEKNTILPTILNKRIQKQRSFQEGHTIKHSKDSEMLVKLLQFSDSKRYNIPSTQILLGNASQSGVPKNLKQTDIRNMFFKSHGANDVETHSVTQDQGKVLPPFEEKLSFGSKELFNEVSDYLSLKLLDRISNCRHCPELIKCEVINIPKGDVSISWTELDDSVYTSVTLEDIMSFRKLFQKFETSSHDDIFDETINFDCIDIPSQIATQTSKVLELEDLIDKSILADFFNESASFQAPKSFYKLSNKYNDSNNCKEKVNSLRSQKELGGEIVDCGIYEDSSNTKIKVATLNNILCFFKLDSLVDIFNVNIINSRDTILCAPNKSESNENTEIDNLATSPVLCSYRKKSKHDKPSLERRPPTIGNIDSPSLFSMNNVSKISSTPQFLSEETLISSKSTKDSPVEHVKNTLGLNDLCDMSIFGLDVVKVPEIRLSTSHVKALFTNSPNTITNISAVSDKCDLDDFCQPIHVKNLSGHCKLPDSVNNETFTSVHKSECDISKSPRISQEKLNNSSDLQDLCDATSFLTSSGMLWNRYDPQNEDVPSANCCKSPCLEIEKRIKSKKSHKTPCKENKKCEPKVVSPSLNIIPQIDLTEISLSPEIGITPLLSLINQPSKNTASSGNTQEEQCNQSMCESKVFNFSFNNKKTPTKQLKFNASNLSDSFNLGTINSPKAYQRQNENSSDEDFEPKQNRFLTRKKREALQKRVVSKAKNEKKFTGDFIEYEAELSLSETIIVSDDEEGDEDDQSYDASFIADESQNIDTQMHVNYLQSVRSPPIKNSGFKIPTKRNIPKFDVYSQEVDKSDDTYINDSFVVHEEEDLEVDDEYSQLELLEMQLKERRKRKNKRVIEKDLKRRRIIIVSSDDSN